MNGSCDNAVLYSFAGYFQSGPAVAMEIFAILLRLITRICIFNFRTVLLIETVIENTAVVLAILSLAIQTYAAHEDASVVQDAETADDKP